ncbi:flavin reductase family protein [Mycolicibacterium sp. BiH015]|uniref:flavin reductase family protein n=1 Tax=Mycolicibacterium sp. BiH015 TaxID=3018808 RepID=UPI0022E860B8|nr:flavin reductase family protein [Mycolicibacterium sp. BiH015]MDA2892903.1 flavin reductase family protein [Mycolicibacterium sp. BiH015]
MSLTRSQQVITFAVSRCHVPSGERYDSRHRRHERQPTDADSAPAAQRTDLRRAFGCFPSGVAAVCADVGDYSTGMLVSSLTSVSMDPPLLSVCIQKGSRTWAALESADALGISFLADGHTGLCSQFTAAGPQRLVGVDVTVTSEGAVLIPDSTAWFVCTRHESISAGDHVIVLLRIESLSVHPDRRPLVFHGSAFRRIAA